MIFINYNNYKDCEPEQTIFNIKKILFELNIFTYEKLWLEKNNIIFSCRVQVYGTNIGANGKGLNKMLALASAYGELMERLQTFHIFKNIDIVKEYENKYNFKVSSDEIKGTLLNLPNCFKKSHIFNNITTYDYYRKERNNFNILLPFENIINSNIEYLPIELIFYINGSNGLCAGNTYEEAITQGFSEIFERYVLKKIFEDNILLPEVKKDYLKQKFPLESKLIENLESTNKYNIIVKDCTFNNIFPVMGLIIIDIKTKKFVVNLGSDPDIRIALQRCLTEVFQGDINLDFKSNCISFKNTSYEKEFNKQLINSSGNWKVQILNKSGYSEPKIKNFSSIKDKYNYYIDLFKKLNISSVYIRDCSFTEFKSYQIVIPGYSEVFINMCDITKKFKLRTIFDKLINTDNTVELYNIVEFINSLSDENMNIDNSYIIIKNKKLTISWNFILFLINKKLNKKTEAVIYLKKHLENIQEKEELLIMNCFYSIINLNFYNNLNNFKNILNNLFFQEVIEYAIYIFNNLYNYNLYLIDEYIKNENEVYINFKKLLANIKN